MALSDPMSVTLGGSAVSLNRVFTNGSVSRYANSDGTVVATVSHRTTSSRNARMIRIDQYKISPDPFVPTQNIRVKQSYWTVTDAPTVGFTVAENLDLLKALEGLKSASTYAVANKVLGGES